MSGKSARNGRDAIAVAVAVSAIAAGAIGARWIADQSVAYLGVLTVVLTGAGLAHHRRPGCQLPADCWSWSLA